MLTTSSINPHGFQAKVGDFGLSREANASARLAGNLYGTITHMAPEVMLHAHMTPVSCRTCGLLSWTTDTCTCVLLLLITDTCTDVPLLWTNSYNSNGINWRERIMFFT